MHFSFLINRCLVLLFTLTVVSSMSNKICQKLRKQHEKIRVLGEAFGGTTLLIITTSGHLFKLKLNSTLRKDSTKGHYYLNIGGEPASHVSEEWPNVPLDLSENKNKLYALQLAQNSRKAVFSSLFKTEKGNWLNSLHSGNCRPSLKIGQSVTKSTVAHFELCNSKTVNDNIDAFMVSRSCSNSYPSTNPILFVKSGANRYYCDGANVDCLNIAYFLSDDTVLAASHLGEPYNILLFIYTSGVVEIRQAPTSLIIEAPSPNWTVPIRDFIQCEATQLEESTTTTDDVPGLWHTHTWRIVIVAVLLTLNGICLVLLYRKWYKKKKKGARKRKGKCSRVKKRKKNKSPDRSSIGPIDSSVDNSITGTRRRAESSPTGSPVTKVSKCPSSISKGSTPKGSTIKPSTLTIRTESGSPLTNESKGSSTQKKKSSKIESSPSSATVSNPSNVNSKALVKLSLGKKKQTTGKWIASFLWAKKKKKKRNNKNKPKDTKKDNEKK